MLLLQHSIEEWFLNGPSYLSELERPQIAQTHAQGHAVYLHRQRPRPGNQRIA